MQISDTDGLKLDNSRL